MRDESADDLLDRAVDDAVTVPAPRRLDAEDCPSTTRDLRDSAVSLGVVSETTAFPRALPTDVTAAPSDAESGTAVLFRSTEVSCSPRDTDGADVSSSTGRSPPSCVTRRGVDSAVLLPVTSDLDRSTSLVAGRLTENGLTVATTGILFFGTSPKSAATHLLLFSGVSVADDGDAALLSKLQAVTKTSNGWGR